VSGGDEGGKASGLGAQNLCSENEISESQGVIIIIVSRRRALVVSEIEDRIVEVLSSAGGADDPTPTTAVVILDDGEICATPNRWIDPTISSG